MIKAILFDFYGVFVPDTYSAWLASNGLKREGAFAGVINLLDTNKISDDEFTERLSELLGRKVTTEEMQNHAKNPDQELIRLVSHLKQTYPIGLLSNASSSLRPKLERYGLVPLFNEIIISSEIGHAKPSDEAFQIAINRLGFSPNEILFFDDNPDNIVAGTNIGLSASIYSSINDIVARLATDGIEVPDHKSA